MPYSAGLETGGLQNYMERAGRTDTMKLTLASLTAIGYEVSEATGRVTAWSKATRAHNIRFKIKVYNCDLK